jgi:hypothetical protein
VAVTKLPKPSMQGAAAGGLANRRAVTCVNAEQASKLLMREPSRLRAAKAVIVAATERPPLLRSRRGIGDGTPGQFSIATREAPLVATGVANRKPVRDRPGQAGWRRGP